MSRTKLTVTIMMVAVVALSFASGATAAKNKIKGQDLFKDFCKPCHGVDSENGEYTPMSLIMDQWDEVYDALEETFIAGTEPTEATAPLPSIFIEDDEDLDGGVATP